MNSIPSSNKETTIKYRLINENTLNKFKYDLANNPEISNIFRTNSGQEAFSKFLTLFNNLYDIYFHIKSKKLTRKGLLKPWVNLTLITHMKIRDNLSKLAKRNQIDKKIFTDFLNLLTTEIRKDSSKYQSYTRKMTTGNARGEYGLELQYITIHQNIRMILPRQHNTIRNR